MNKKLLKKSVLKASDDFYHVVNFHRELIEKAKNNFLAEMKWVLHSNNINLVTDEEIDFKVEEILNDQKFMSPKDVEEVEVYSQILHAFIQDSDDYDLDELLEIYPQLLNPKQ